MTNEDLTSFRTSLERIAAALEAMGPEKEPEPVKVEAKPAKVETLESA